MRNRIALGCTVVLLAASCLTLADDWQVVFDGASMEGWARPFGEEAEVVFDEDFSDSGMKDDWEATDPKAWEIASLDSDKVLHLRGQSDYKPAERSPRSILWLMDDGPESFVMDAIVKYTGKPGGHADLCLFFGRQDDSHFYYAHLGQKADRNAHTVHVVDGKPRTPLETDRTDGMDWGRKWHRIRLERNAQNGDIQIYANDLEEPIMKANDKRFVGGSIGVGSFDNTGYFDTIRIIGIK